VVRSKSTPQNSFFRFSKAVHQDAAERGVQNAHPQVEGAGLRIATSDPGKEVSKFCARAGPGVIAVK